VTYRIPSGASQNPMSKRPRSRLRRRFGFAGTNTFALPISPIDTCLASAFTYFAFEGAVLTVSKKPSETDPWTLTPFLDAKFRSWTRLSPFNALRMLSLGPLSPIARLVCLSDSVPCELLQDECATNVFPMVILPPFARARLCASSQSNCPTFFPQI